MLGEEPPAKRPDHRAASRLAQTSPVRMTDRNRQRIGGVGVQASVQAEERLHHVLDLHLVGAARTDDRQLDLARRIFEDLHGRGKGAAQRRAARLAELERAVGVAMHEHALDGDLGGRVARDQLANLGVDLLQAPRELHCAGVDGAARDVRGGRPDEVDDAVPGMTRTGIEPQDAGAPPPSSTVTLRLASAGLCARQDLVR